MDFRGWNSSYTGDPIPLEEMEEWRSATVDRIMALQPRRVLEIGVGSGLLLAHVAPECVEYWGTDFSAPTIQTLQAAVASQSWGDRVRLRVQPADVADGLPQGHFDAVVLNSVIQYFPSAGYLPEVLDNAVDLLAPGGTLFIGDVRNHSLQGAFQTGVALARTGTGDADDIRQRVQRAVLGEPELLLAPEFFTNWAAEHPSVAGVDIELKRGEADNELTRYRYDVIVHKCPTSVCSLAGAPTWAWTDCAGLSGLHTRVDVPASGRRARHRDPPRRGDRRRPHRTGPGRRATPGRGTGPRHSPRPSTPPPLNSCTALAKPPDITSRSPGALTRHPGRRLHHRYRCRARPGGDRCVPVLHRGPPAQQLRE